MSTVSLNHRLAPNYDASELFDMTTTAIETSLLKASAILGLVSSVVIHDTTNELDREKIYWAINSAISDLDDISSFIEAYHVLTTAKAQAQKNPEL